MKVLASTALAVLAITIIVYEYRRARAVPYDFLFLFNVSYLVYYILAPLHLILGGGQFTNFPSVVESALERDSSAFLIGYVTVIAMTWFLVCMSYEAASRHCTVSRTYFSEVRSRDLLIVTCVFLLLGAASLFVYASQYDGIEFTIRNASAIRGRQFTNESSLLFLRNISLLSVSAVLLAICISLRINRGLLKWLSRAVLAILLVIAVLTLASQGSRRSYVIFLACIGLFYANYRNRRYVWRICAIAIIALAYIAVGDLLNFGLNQGMEFILSGLQQYGQQGFGIAYARLWSDFSLPVVESWAVLSQFSGVPRFFVDVPLGVLEMVPERLVDLPLPTRLSDLSTPLITGQSADVVAEVPPAFLGFFWYSGYSLGLVIGPCLYGALGGWVERHLRPDRNNDPLPVMLYTIAGFLWAYFLREGIPYMLYVERFHWWALLVSLVLLQVWTKVLAQTERLSAAAR